MAMSKVMMATAIKNGMDGVDPTGYDLQDTAGVAAYRQALLEAFSDAVIKHIQSNAEIIIATAFSSGVPVPNDGGAALQTAWSAQPNLSGAIQ
jgi:hypothetical protein